MAHRVSDIEVKEIIETSLDTTPFINTAHALIEDKLGDSTLLGETMLKEIELWTSAHFVAIRERQAKSEKTGDASVTYFGKDGMGLEATPYGQQALLLDISGTLANLGKKKAEFIAIDLDLD